jgi:hypothetical protein
MVRRQERKGVVGYSFKVLRPQHLPTGFAAA